MKRGFRNISILLVVSAFTISTAWGETVAVGHLTDFTGPTAGVGAHYGPGVIDALNYGSNMVTL